MRISERRLRSACGGITALALPGVAHAHLVSTRFGDFYAGLLHPLTALENLLPWIALGLLAGMHEPRTSRWLLVLFPAGLAIGVWLGGEAPEWAALSTASYVAFIVLGLVVASGLRLPDTLLWSLGALCGLLYGYDNGLAMVRTTNALLFCAGVTTAGYVTLALLAAGSSLVRERKWGTIAIRAASSWIAAVGIIMVTVSTTA
ncbi:MAG TPA: HupE/UreJ family protein [Steroidobacteraceae bacterium]|nr:HupE/UreJ family protein [Steroidobacteraceae bacterium]